MKRWAVFVVACSDDSPKGNVDMGLADTGSDASGSDLGMDQAVEDAAPVCVAPTCADLVWSFDGQRITVQSSKPLISTMIKGELSTYPLPTPRVVPYFIDGEYVDGSWVFEFSESNLEFDVISFLGFEFESCDGPWEELRIGSGDINEKRLDVTCGVVR